MKGVIIVAAIIAPAATLGACRKEVAHDSMKLGATPVVVQVAE